MRSAVKIDWLMIGMVVCSVYGGVHQKKLWRVLDMIFTYVYRYILNEDMKSTDKICEIKHTVPGGDYGYDPMWIYPTPMTWLMRR